jgi:hypothetical protein
MDSNAKTQLVAFDTDAYISAVLAKPKKHRRKRPPSIYEEINLIDMIEALDAQAAMPAMVEVSESASAGELKFWKFHCNNPQVYAALRHFSLQMKKAGRRKYGMKAIAERVRFHFDLTTDDAQFKFNNNYTSRYARLLMKQVPELQGFFDMRELKT